MERKKLLSNVYGSLEDNDLFIDESDLFIFDPEDLISYERVTDEYGNEVLFDDTGKIIGEDYEDD